MSDRILIVEDERKVAEDLRNVVGKLGYHVTSVVSSGAEAIREAECNSFDLALIDMWIKGKIDGIEIAHILRKLFDIPVVYLTAHGTKKTLDRAKQTEPLSYLIKPFQIVELHATIEMALYKQRHYQKLYRQQQHLTDVLSTVPLAIISVDQAGIISLFNPPAALLTGFSQEDAIGAPLNKVFRLTDMASGADINLRWDQIVTELHHFFLATKQGVLKAIVGHISPIRNSDGSRGAVVIFESSPQKRGDAFVQPAIVMIGGLLNPSFGGGENDVIHFDGLDAIVASKSMKEVFAFALRVARSEASMILLEGETGTGKDVLARFLHSSSARHAGPFVPINCSAIPETLIESELFGHEQGAFSDARASKKGLFEIANGGTIFLDEIGELSLINQTKLLRVLEYQSFRRLGGIEDRDVDVRIIAATNRYLVEDVQAGRFRLDLFHRLNVIQITLPPLREHKQDILPLANHFVRCYRSKYNPSIQGISPPAEAILSEYEWPGNVRELRHVLERAMLLEDTNWIQPLSLQLIGTPKHGIPPIDHEPPRPLATDMSLKTSERNLINLALEKCDGNQTKACVLLGISRDKLRYRIKRLTLSSKTKP